MAYKNRKNRNTGDTPRRKQQRAQMAKKVSKPIKQYVKKALSRKAETKMGYLLSDGSQSTGLHQVPIYQTIVTIPSGSGSPGSATWVPAGVQPVMPALGQGVNEGNRIGNRVDMKGLYVKGHVTIDWTVLGSGALGTDVTSPEIYVRILCIEKKDALREGRDATSFSTFLDKAGDNYSPLGRMGDIYLPVDKKGYNVYYDKVMKIRNPLGFNQTSGGYQNALQNSVRLFKFKIGSKKLQYSSNLDNVPSNFNPQILAFVIDPSNISRDTSNAWCEYSYVSTVYYEDN